MPVISDNTHTTSISLWAVFAPSKVTLPASIRGMLHVFFCDIDLSRQRDTCAACTGCNSLPIRYYFEAFGRKKKVG